MARGRESCQRVCRCPRLGREFLRRTLVVPEARRLTLGFLSRAYPGKGKKMMFQITATTKDVLGCTGR